MVHSLFDLRALLACMAAISLLVTSPSAASSEFPAHGHTETFGPLPGGRLGVVHNNLLQCFEVGRLGWRRCKDWQAIELPPDTQRILSNERTLSVVRSKQIDFYDEEATPSQGKPLHLAEDWSVHRMTNGEYSTEREMVLRNQSQLLIRMPGDPDSNATISLNCPEAENKRVFGLFGPARWALIDSSGMLAVALRKTPTGIVCVREPERDWLAPSDVDEIAVIQLDLLAMRTGQHIHFLKYNPMAKAWRSATEVVGSQPIQDLRLDDWLSGAPPQIKKIMQSMLPDKGALAELIARVVPSQYDQANTLSDRFVRVAKRLVNDGESDTAYRFGVLDANGTEIFPPVYAQVQHDSQHFRFLVAKDSKGAARWLYLDESGRPMSETAFDHISGLSNSGSEPTALVTIRDKMGYFDFVQGKMLVDPTYDFLVAESLLIDRYGEGVLIARREDRWGLVNTHGQALTEQIYDRISLTRDGLIGLIDDKRFRLHVVETQLTGIEQVHLKDTFDSNRSKQFGGIGAKLGTSAEGTVLYVVHLFKNSPAIKAGIKIQDQIIKVNGQSVAQMGAPEAIKLIRGEADSIVLLTIQRGQRLRDIRVKRDLVKIE